MKLKEFNIENCGSNVRSTLPAVSFDFKVGAARVNREACLLVGLKEGDQVKFHQDLEEPENWYLEKVKSGGFELRKHAGPSLMFNSSRLAKRVAESVAFDGRSGRCLVAGQATVVEKRKLYGIITGRLRNN